MLKYIAAMGSMLRRCPWGCVGRGSAPRAGRLQEAQPVVLGHRHPVASVAAQPRAPDACRKRSQSSWATATRKVVTLAPGE